MTIPPGLELIDRRGLRPALQYPWAIGHIESMRDVGRWHTKREALAAAEALGRVTDWGAVPKEDVLRLARAEMARLGGAPGRLSGAGTEPEAPAPRPEPEAPAPRPRRDEAPIPAPRREDLVGGPDQPGDAYGLWMQDDLAICPDCHKFIGVALDGRPVHLMRAGDGVIIGTCPARLERAIAR